MKYLKRKIVIYSLLAGLIFISSHSVAKAEESSLIDRINNIRKAPYTYGLTLGLSQSQLSECGLTKNTSFDIYNIDESLNTIAFQLNKSAMGVESGLEGQMPVSSQISDVGGILEFSNFISMDAAGKIFVDNLVKKEIESGDFQHILSNDYVGVGVSVLAGITQGDRNAWFFTLCFDAKSSVSEAVLLTLINQLRADPWAVVIFNLLGNNLSGTIDPVTARALLRKMPPVFLNRALLETARIAVQTGDAIGIASDSDEIQGYEGTFLEEISGTVQLEDDSQKKAVNRIFGNILEYELDNFQDNPGILDYDAADIGLAVMAAEIQNDSASMGFGMYAGIPQVTDEEEDCTENKIYGVVYVDQDKNGLYSPGEEVCGRDISIREQNFEDVNKDPVMIKTITTDAAGRFILTLPTKKMYRFSCASQNTDTESFDLYKYLYKDVFLSLTLPLSEE